MGATCCFYLFVVAGLVAFFFLLYESLRDAIRSVMLGHGLWYGYMIDPSMAILLAVASIAFLCTYMFFMVRLCFYFPAVVFGEPAPALGRSLDLTEKNMWRLVGLLLVVYLIIFVIMSPLLILGFLPPATIIETLVARLLSVISGMFFSTTMAVAYFDLVKRHDAEDSHDLAAQHNS